MFGCPASEDPHSLEDNFFPFSFSFWVIPDDAQKLFLALQALYTTSGGAWQRGGILSARDRIQVSQFQGKNLTLY